MIQNNAIIIIIAHTPCCKSNTRCREKSLKPITPFIHYVFVVAAALLSDLNPKKKNHHAPKSLAVFFAPIIAE